MVSTEMIKKILLGLLFVSLSARSSSAERKLTIDQPVSDRQATGGGEQAGFGVAPNPFFCRGAACATTLFPSTTTVPGTYSCCACRRSPIIRAETFSIGRNIPTWRRRAAPGGVVEHNGTFYYFYTFNQTIALTTSPDLEQWTPYEHNPVLTADDVVYDRGHFRDPYVFFNAQEKCWWMVFCSRCPSLPGQRRRLRGVGQELGPVALGGGRSALGAGHRSAPGVSSGVPS